MTHVAGAFFAVVLLGDAFLLIALVAVASATGDMLRFIPGQSSEGSLATAGFLTLIGAYAVELVIRGLIRVARGDPVPPGQGPFPVTIVLALLLLIPALVLLDSLGLALAEVRRLGSPIVTDELRLTVAILVAWIPAIPMRTLLRNKLREPTTKCVIERGDLVLQLPYIDAGSIGPLRRRSVRVALAKIDSVRILPPGDPVVYELSGETFGGRLWKGLTAHWIDLVLDGIRPRTRVEGEAAEPSLLLWWMPFGALLELRGPNLLYVVSAHPDDARMAVEAFARYRSAPA